MIFKIFLQSLVACSGCLTSITTKQVSDGAAATLSKPPRAAPRLCKPIIGNYGRIVNHANAKQKLWVLEIFLPRLRIFFVCFFSPRVGKREWIFGQRKRNRVGALGTFLNFIYWIKRIETRGRRFDLRPLGAHSICIIINNIHWDCAAIAPTTRWLMNEWWWCWNSKTPPKPNRKSMKSWFFTQMKKSN